MRERERGIALVSVLWGVAILSVIVATMLATNITNMRVGRNAWALARANALVDGGVHRAVLALLETRPDHAVRVDGTPWRFSLDGTQMTITIQDENGRIDLNNADPAILASLFQTVGVVQDQAKSLAASIAGLRPREAPPNAVVFHSVDEVRGIAGMTSALFVRVEPALTVYSHSAGVDATVAPREVLAALPDISSAAIADTLAERDEAYRAGMLAPPNPGAGHAFEITVWTAFGNIRLKRCAVVEFTGDKDNPFLFVAWK